MRQTGWTVVAIVSLVVLANIVVVGITFLPLLVTYAEVPPTGVACGHCTEPEVQRALARAAAIGRGQILERVQSVWLWWLLPAVLNVAAVLLVWRVARGSSAV